MSIQRLEHEAHPSSNLPFHHRHHYHARLATDPSLRRRRRLTTAVSHGLLRKRDFEMFHYGRDDDEHLQDAF